MNIIVFVKQVADTEARVQIAGDGTSIDTLDLNFILNPFDEFAVEEALRTAEKLGGEVTVISLGNESAAGVIRTALAMGADRGLLLKTGARCDDPLQVARALAAEIAGSGFDLAFFGKQAVGNDHGQVGILVAELIGVPGISMVSGLEVETGGIRGKREIEGGTESFECGLPAVVATQKGLNEPRYASLKGRMAAKKKTIEEKEVSLAEPLLEVESLNYPPQRERGRVLGEGAGAVPELVRCLREDAKVI
ncbi:MAG: electron transfer flavoprotein subunit beta/FixA family protein [Candidatus Glassbacteria bacterium]|nr:electron transfer flavoprotein subunit beta/FixA family protein [Candidatus Glassbacteria bacterium]